MLSKKEQHAQRYRLRTNCSRQDKMSRIRNQTDQIKFFESIKVMSEEQLLFLMQRKYHKMIRLFQHKADLAIAHRINSLRQTFMKQEKDRYFDFILRAGRKIDDGDYQNALDQSAIHTPRNCTLTTGFSEDLLFYRFESSEINQTATFVLKRLPENIRYETEAKRVKKDGILFLCNFLEYKAKLARIYNL